MTAPPNSAAKAAAIYGSEKHERSRIRPVSCRPRPRCGSMSRARCHSCISFNRLPNPPSGTAISTMWEFCARLSLRWRGLCSVTFEVMAGSLFCAAYKKYRPRPAKPLPANTATADVAADESRTAWLRYKCRKQSNPKTRGTRRPSAMLPRHYVLPRQIPSGVSPLEAADGRQTRCAVC